MISVATLSGTVELGERAVGQLRTRLSGPLLLPGQPGYDGARTIWNRMIDRRPALIARPAGADDVVTALGFAREHDLLISVRGGGHNVTGNAVCEGGLMLDLSAMKGARVDARAHRIVAEPGLTWKDFDTAAQAHGLATTGGIVSSTGVAGLTLGGGHGWLMRKHGLTCDNLLAVDLVTAGARRIRASAEENAELFWAVRGGGGNFGIVTAFEFRLHPLTAVLAGTLLYPRSRARDVLDVFREQAEKAPDELTLGVVITTWHDGRAVIGLVACHSGALADGERCLQPFRRLGTPLIDGIRPMGYGELQTMFDATNPPGAWYYKTGYLDGAAVRGDRFVDVLLEHCDFPSPSPMSRIFIEHLGGAMGRVPPHATAFVHRAAPFDLIVVAGGFPAEATEQNLHWARATSNAMRPFMSGAAYVNYLGADAGVEAVRAAYGPAFERLVDLKERYDPHNVFRLNQNIRPTTPA
ncbi:MAG TPA: FAD-binding oxidoreductase [Methylomirabilota bacterium]